MITEFGRKPATPGHDRSKVKAEAIYMQFCYPVSVSIFKRSVRRPATYYERIQLRKNNRSQIQRLHSESTMLFWKLSKKLLNGIWNMHYSFTSLPESLNCSYKSKNSSPKQFWNLLIIVGIFYKWSWSWKCFNRF